MIWRLNYYTNKIFTGSWTRKESTLTDTHQAETHSVVKICYSLSRTRAACTGKCTQVSYYKNVPSPQQIIDPHWKGTKPGAVTLTSTIKLPTLK